MGKVSKIREISLLGIQTTVGTEQLMWPVLKGPEGPDQPWRLLSKQSSKS